MSVYFNMFDMSAEWIGVRTYWESLASAYVLYRLIYMAQIYKYDLPLKSKIQEEVKGEEIRGLTSKKNAYLKSDQGVEVNIKFKR